MAECTRLESVQPERVREFESRPLRLKVEVSINHFNNMETKKLTLSILPEKLGICHLDKNTPIPSWALEGASFISIGKTRNELSIICPQDKIPGGVMFEKDWRAFKIEGPLGFTATGIVSSISTPLAKAGISIMYISTYETDHVLVEEHNLEKAEEILGEFCDIKK